MELEIWGKISSFLFFSRELECSEMMVDSLFSICSFLNLSSSWCLMVCNFDLIYYLSFFSCRMSSFRRRNALFLVSWEDKW